MEPCAAPRTRSPQDQSPLVHLVITVQGPLVCLRPPGSTTEDQDQEAGSDGTNEEVDKEADYEEEEDKDGSVKEEVKCEAAASGPDPDGPAPPQPYSCRWCKKGFAFKCRLRAHLKCCALSQEPKHQCPQCPQRLPTVRALQRHRGEAHPNAPQAKKKVACDLCGRTFAHPSGRTLFNSV